MDQTEDLINRLEKAYRKTVNQFQIREELDERLRCSSRKVKMRYLRFTLYVAGLHVLIEERIKPRDADNNPQG